MKRKPIKHRLNHDGLMSLIKQQQEALPISKFRHVIIPSLREIATECGVSVSTLSRLRYKKDLSAEALLAILAWVHSRGTGWDEIIKKVVVK